MHRAGLVRLVRMGLVYLLVAAAAALGWLWHALPEEICLEPGQTLQLPRFAWVEPLRGRGSRNVASTRAVGSYQVTLALGGWLPGKSRSCACRVRIRGRSRHAASAATDAATE